MSQLARNSFSFYSFFSPRSRYRHCPNSGEKGNAGPGSGSGPCGGAGCARRGVEQDPKGPVAWQLQRSSGGDGESGIEQLLQGTWRGTERRAGRGGGGAAAWGGRQGCCAGGGRGCSLSSRRRGWGCGTGRWARRGGG